MASAAPLEDLACCPVCFEVYINPQSLNCRHVLCRECVNQLTVKNQLECPICRHISQSSDVKQDFNKQTLVDLYLQTPENDKSVARLISEKNSTSSVLLCDICKNSNKSAAWRCESCEKYMCEVCQQAHSSFPVTKEHGINSIKEIANTVSQTLQETTKTIIQNIETMENKSKDREKFSNKLDCLQIETVKKINKRREILKLHIDKQHDEVIFKFKDKIRADIDITLNEKQQIDKCIIESFAKLELLNQLTNTNDTVTLVTDGPYINSAVQAEVINVNTYVNKIKERGLPGITVVGSTDHDLSNVTQVQYQSCEIYEKSNAEMDKPAANTDEVVFLHSKSYEHATLKRTNALLLPAEFKDQPSNVHNLDVATPVQCSRGIKFDLLRSPKLFSTKPISQEKFNYFDMLDKKFNFLENLCTDLQYSPVRLHLVENKLWCTGTDGLYVYDKNHNLQNCIKHVNRKYSKAIIQDHKGDMIIACVNKIGLLHIGLKTGKYKHEISSGDFCDVVLFKEMLYALEHVVNEIQIYYYDDDINNWVIANKIKLTYEYVCALDTISVFDHQSIYLASFNNNTIYKVGPNGVMEEISHNLHTTKTLCGPRLCSIDDFGNVLVADYHRSRLVVISSSREPSMYVNIEKGVQLPKDVTVDKSGNIWVCTTDCKLVKYTRENAKQK